MGLRELTKKEMLNWKTPIPTTLKELRSRKRKKATKKKSRKDAAIKMADIEHKLGTKGLPKSKNYLEKIRKKLGTSGSLRPIGTRFKTGGKVYKVDNLGQQIVAKQYGGKVK